MALVNDIAGAYRRPRPVFAGLLARGVDDKTGLVFLLLAMGLGFLSQLPGVSRRANLPDPELDAAILAERADVRPIEGVEVPDALVDAKFSAFLSAEIMVWFLILPLVFYGVAMVGHLVVRLLGGRPDGTASRLALFWALLVAVPLKLLHGLTFGMLGPGIEVTLVGVLWFAILMWNWSMNLRVAGWETRG
ncbi:hypothetical protein HKCCE4037_01765 [Rhodobacterales bacterium HKCCE4037]|nr:hypothetical protein [Rhodobacterales bacterium HKCCE4037]